MLHFLPIIVRSERGIGTGGETERKRESEREREIERGEREIEQF